MPVSTVRNLTQGHAPPYRYEQPQVEQRYLKTACCPLQLGELDDAMLPIMTPTEQAKDKRKQKRLPWKEARLALVHDKGRMTPIFGARFEVDVDDVGQILLNGAIEAGFGRQTQVLLATVLLG